METVQQLAGNQLSVARCLRGGGVVLVPTDTVYGLAALPDYGAAVERIFSMKRRPNMKNLPIIVDGLDQLASLGVDITVSAEKLVASPYVPGPITIALGFVSGGSRPAWLAGRIEVAVRVPRDRALRQLATRVGPIAMTSANETGQVTHESIDRILPALAGSPDVVVDGGQRSTIPSTLVNCRVDPPIVEREGAVSVQKVMGIVSGR